MSSTMAEHQAAYNSRIEELRSKEFPMIQGDVYLDHAGTTLYPKSLMDCFVADMTTNLYGNPHSASISSQRSTTRIDDIRLAALRFFSADPADFDLVFVANATAGIKLVADAFRAAPEGFHFLYHQASHTSVVGVREEAKTSRCLSNHEATTWVSGTSSQNEAGQGVPTLFAYPAQSNMDGQKFPLDWSTKARQVGREAGGQVFTLLDAAALVATSPLDLANVDAAPDFLVLSFNKVFGFPNLGALIIRRQAYPCFQHRKYFGGGTVDMVLSIGEQWHSVKSTRPHEALEDGTLPLHNILALGHAVRLHRELFGPMQEVAAHTMFLRQHLSSRLCALHHTGSGLPVCTMYSGEDPGDGTYHGPTLAFNIRDATGAWVSTAEFEKLAVLKHFHIRTGGLCNPGGIAAALQLQPWELKQNFSEGFRCDNGNDIMKGKPTGVIRVSLGAMSTISDVDRFADFVEEFYATSSDTITPGLSAATPKLSGLYVDHLVVYPIKSCGGFRVSAETTWEVRREGLAWDREWCLVHLGTGQALSQKRYPRMALIKPSLDLVQGKLNITYVCPKSPNDVRVLSVPLSTDATAFKTITPGCAASSRVCGENVLARIYAADEINDFFSGILETPCALARFPAGGAGQSMRHAKAHLQKHQRSTAPKAASQAGVDTPPDSDNEVDKPKILLSNESPILAISLKSLDALNSEIVRSGRGSPVSAEVFRANVVIGHSSSDKTSFLPAYDEDHWSTIAIGSHRFRMMGSCRRCHMVCINQSTAEKTDEPFITLTKTRKFDGKVFFGTHMCWTPRRMDDPLPARIQVGEAVIVDP
ncbi:MOSC N-terminal beta barrel domain-containing protein [Microdochium trichocladiopsis]|uniref:Molybdenum cofactor sulfurase n=1 Tax=Microdochium trichocladiopsis TaxID=1682393 RepID=A0A9P9BQG1_9PEZI|nr:MOSC N-terminal beta barrel domain-containing protein [Microdochium trichocladiopsis]KAH7034843.1 MOSC N-terminal beta barrel domain-containing protein [Microdochium trichocladiopsis]